jgi:hypothetical protein
MNLEAVTQEVTQKICSSDDSDDSSETLVPKLSKVLENINEVMTW